MDAWRLVLPLTIVSLLVFCEDRASIPSCEIVPNGHLEEDDPEDLKVMMVANLLLLGSEAGLYNTYFRRYYLSKFFKKSFESLSPDMLFVLGDVSARGSYLPRSKWSSVVQQFQRILGPFNSHPFHVLLGDRDVGECSKLNPISVRRMARSFPGSDSAGFGAFEVSNISFVSLNAVALLFGNTELRFKVETVIERESIDLQMETGSTREMMTCPNELRENSLSFGWRENAVSAGSGPVVLLHFPLHRKEVSSFVEGIANSNPPKRSSKTSWQISRRLESSRFVGAGLYELLQSLPLNATEYIFQALRPRIVFSAHTHEFCDHTHLDGTREITVPAMSWDARDDPGFVVATFRKRKAELAITHCFLARESHVLLAYISSLFLLILTMSLQTHTFHNVEFMVREFIS